MFKKHIFQLPPLARKNKTVGTDSSQVLSGQTGFESRPGKSIFFFVFSASLPLFKHCISTKKNFFHFSPKKFDFNDNLQHMNEK